MVEESNDVACLRAILSVQDLLSVGGASGREGLQRTAPRREKFERPRRAATVEVETLDSYEDEDDVIVGGGDVHGVASSCASIMSSMLASPHGASEQYM